MNYLILLVKDIKDAETDLIFCQLLVHHSLHMTCNQGIVISGIQESMLL